MLWKPHKLSSHSVCLPNTGVTQVLLNKTFALRNLNMEGVVSPGKTILSSLDIQKINHAIPNPSQDRSFMFSNHCTGRLCTSLLGFFNPRSKCQHRSWQQPHSWQPWRISWQILGCIPS